MTTCSVPCPDERRVLPRQARTTRQNRKVDQAFDPRPSAASRRPVSTRTSPWRVARRWVVRRACVGCDVSCDNVGVLGWPAAEDVDWGVLFHAYGPADETPAHLRALTADDHKAQLDAMDHLFYEVLHQGTVYPATAVAVRVVSGLLGDVQLRRQGADGQSLLADALDFLDGAAEQAVLCPVENAEGAPTVPKLKPRQVEGYFAALEEGEDIEPFLPAINALWRAGMADLQAAADEVYRAAEPFLRDTDIAVRIRTVGLLTRLVQLPTAAENRDSLRSDLLSRSHDITDRNELASAVLGSPSWVLILLYGWLTPIQRSVPAQHSRCMTTPRPLRCCWLRYWNPRRSIVGSATRPAGSPTECVKRS